MKLLCSDFILKEVAIEFFFKKEVIDVKNQEKGGKINSGLAETKVTEKTLQDRNIFSRYLKM